ncbi:MAG: 30S ribosomal protein S8 [Chloroflexota bacterium]|uniref:30S ribosomal protein S8 n=1 Tax=marine metagenome TaxID=408172 RepID=A0A381UVN5_9ZZZZ|nr:30S ribosomal protein S8 [Chloroflexota bacterium]
MAVSDPIADMLTRIRNAIMVGHQIVSVPSSTMKLEIARILREEGFITDFDVKDEDEKTSTFDIELHYWQKNDPAITGLKRVSKPGLRVYVSKDDIPHIYGGSGIAVMSTNQGVMSGAQARASGVGGEVLFYIW